VVITIIYFVVGVYGKGFPVGSSPSIYLNFLFRPFSQSLISSLCGWCAVGLIPDRPGLMVFSLDPRWIKHRGWSFFFTIASAARSLCSQ